MDSSAPQPACGGGADTAAMRPDHSQTPPCADAARPLAGRGEPCKVALARCDMLSNSLPPARDGGLHSDSFGGVVRRFWSKVEHSHFLEGVKRFSSQDAHSITA